MRAVILAGGRGTRLRPFTTNFPKPLMPIGERPILELLLGQLASHGIRDVVVLCGHLAYLIEGYFGDGAAFGVNVRYVREEEPLGTAGPLRQLAGQVDGDILVMNGDLLTDVDFTALLEHHRAAEAAATVSVYRRHERIELGVLQVGEDDDVTGYDEKPTLDVDVSMGLYALTPRALELIPEGFYDMPHLILSLLAHGERVAAYRHHGLWMDIGRVDDYERANALYLESPGTFLPHGVGQPEVGGQT